jgi:hypothetical protein
MLHAVIFSAAFSLLGASMQDVTSLDASKIRCNTIGTVSFNKSDVPMRYALLSCPEQSPFTCCGAEQDSLIARMGAMCEMSLRISADSSDYSSLSALKCCQQWRNLQCFACDGLAALSIGYGVCRSTCDDVYSVCAEAMMAWDANGRPLLCSSDSLACAKLGEFVQSGTQLCESLGFPVASTEDGPVCFSGHFVQPSSPVLTAVHQHLQDAGIQAEELVSRRKRRKRRGFSGIEVDDDDGTSLSVVQHWLRRFRLDPEDNPWISIAVAAGLAAYATYRMRSVVFGVSRAHPASDDDM